MGSDLAAKTYLISVVAGLSLTPCDSLKRPTARVVEWQTQGP